MAYIVEVEIGQQNKTVQSGKGSGDAVFATEKEAQSVAEMFTQTLDGCKASVVDRGPSEPTR